MRTSGAETRRVRCGLITVMISVVVLASSPVAGQGTVASIIGQVTDDSGAVLPGVMVTATSPALQVPQVTDVTNELGEYRLAPLPIGIYTLGFELSGFRPARREGVRLTVGFTARIDIELNIASVAETITVSGSAPVVDVKSSSATTLLTRETLELLPQSRTGIVSLLTLAPGVRTNAIDVGGSAMTDNPNARTFGQGGGSWYQLEGIPSSKISGATGGSNYWDYQTIDEVRVSSLAADAEFPTRGVQIHAIVKSGSNAFHGGGLLAKTNRHFQSHNISDALVAQGIRQGVALLNRDDFAGDLGGRLIRNKLWFYGAARRHSQETEVLNTFKPDGSPATAVTVQKWYTGKLSWQATPANRLIGFGQLYYVKVPLSLEELRAFENRRDGYERNRFVKGEWQGTRGNSIVGSVLYGIFLHPRGSDFTSPEGSLVGRSDIVTQRWAGENIQSGESAKTHRKTFRADVTWYKPNWFYGNHEFKAGGDYQDYLEVPVLLRRAANYHLRYANGVPFQLVALNAPSFAKDQFIYLNTYVRDSWTIGRRLTLNLGLRFARENGAALEVCQETADSPAHVAFPARCYPREQLPIYNSMAPRLYVAYDLFGDGKTVVKGGWGRYDLLRAMSEAEAVTRSVVTYAVYTWRDPNGNNDYEAGEVNLDPNGRDFVTTTGTNFGSAGNPTPRGVVNPDEKQRKSDEFSLSFERELFPNFAVRATGVYSTVVNTFRTQNNLRPYGAYNVPVTNLDPGPDGVVRTADDPGRSITYYEFSPALAGAQFEQFMPINDSNADSHFSSIEVAATKRLTNRWQFMTAYSATKKHRPIFAQLAVGGNNLSAQAGPLNPNAEINQADNTWDWDGKVTGAYVFPADILVSAEYEIRSGDAFARQVLFRGGATIPSIVLNVEPIGSQRLPVVNLLSLRGSKGFRTFDTHKLWVNLNLFNALNASTATGLQARAGNQFLRPTAILPPRIAEVSLSYTF